MGTSPYVPSATAAQSTATFGNVTLGPGNSTITSTVGSTVGVSTALTFGTLTRQPGATPRLRLASGDELASAVGSTFNTVKFTGAIPGQTTTTGGFNIIPYAIVTSVAGTADFATNLGGGSIGAFNNYVNGIANSTSPLDVVKQTQGDTSTVTAAGTTIAALLIEPGAASIQLGLGGTLTIGTGAVVVSASGAFTPSITGGTLAFGGSGDGVLITAEGGAPATAITTTITSAIATATG